MAKRWHILRTAAGQERKVVAAIAAGHYDVGRAGLRTVWPARRLEIGDTIAAAPRRMSPVEAWAPEYERQCYRRRRNAAARVTTERRRLFPGYVFVRFDHLADAWGWLLGVPRVAGIVTVGESPAALPQKAVARIREIVGEADDEVARPFAPGDRVMIERDAWFGHVGELIELDDQGRGKVLLSIFGGLHRVTTAPGELVRV